MPVYFDEQTRKDIVSFTKCEPMSRSCCKASLSLHSVLQAYILILYYFSSCGVIVLFCNNNNKSKSFFAIYKIMHARFIPVLYKVLPSFVSCRHQMRTEPHLTSTSPTHHHIISYSSTYRIARGTKPQDKLRRHRESFFEFEGVLYFACSIGTSMVKRKDGPLCILRNLFVLE